jgi:hypothetical protein
LLVLDGRNINYTGKRPQSVRGEEVNVPDTSNSSYETVTDEVRHHRNCRSRTFYGFHQDLSKSFSQGPVLVIKGPAAPGVDLTRSHKHLYAICKIFMQGPLRGSQKDLHKIFC